MATSRPAGVVTIAVLHFVFGGLGLICGTCGAVVELGGGQNKILEQMGANDPEVKKAQEHEKQREEIAEKFLDQKAPWHKTWTVVEAVLTFALSLTMIVAGVGLLGMKSWGRWMSVLYAVVSIATTLFTVYYAFSYAVPAQQEAVRQMPADDPQEKQGEEWGLKIGPYVPLLFLIYPSIVLLVMLLPSTGKAFSEDRGEDEDDPYGPRRRRDDDYGDQGGWAER